MRGMPACAHGADADEGSPGSLSSASKAHPPQVGACERASPRGSYGKAQRGSEWWVQAGGVHAAQMRPSRAGARGQIAQHLNTAQLPAEPGTIDGTSRLTTEGIVCPLSRALQSWPSARGAHKRHRPRRISAPSTPRSRRKVGAPSGGRYACLRRHAGRPMPQCPARAERRLGPGTRGAGRLAVGGRVPGTGLPRASRSRSAGPHPVRTRPDPGSGRGGSGSRLRLGGLALRARR